MGINKVEVLSEIKGFLDGYNTDLKYLVNVETNPDVDFAECIIHEPGKNPEIHKIKYTPFMYMKDLELNNLKLYSNNPEIIENKKIQYGITITSLKTGNHKRLKNGYCYKISSSKSYNAIINFLKDGRIYPYEKLRDDEGNEVKDNKGEPIYLYRDMFYAPKTTEQFFISTGIRLFKGFEEYKQIHKVTFDIETTGLRYQLHRVFAIGVRDNRGFEIILEVEKRNDDDSEIKLIQDFFNLIAYLKPAIIMGHNIEDFDFEFILGRAKLLKMDLSQLPTTLKDNVSLRRRPNVSVKYGNSADKFTATEMWGCSVIDTLHAAKKTAAINSDLKETGLKYVAKFEKFARPNRTYIPGEDNAIGRYYTENKIFLVNEKNEYVQLPDEYQIIGKKLYTLQANKEKIGDEEYKKLRKTYLEDNLSFVGWFKENALPKNMNKFLGGRKLVKQYLLDDLWETEQVDETYNQSSFMLAKIVPTTYQRICTMGTAAIWNLLLTTWSYENDLAIPHPDEKVNFSGGLARCYKVGYNEKLVKIDYASLYPMLQLTWDIFPIFDITGVIKKMLLYLTTTRNIYKKLANNDVLNSEELQLLKEIDPDVYKKLLNNQITDTDRALFKVKQLPIKILNNSLFGALGSDISFNWSDNVCAARITCCGRLELRHSVSWFNKFNCIPLLAVTDGVNFQIPIKTTIRVSDDGVFENEPEGLIEDMWQYDNKKGISALISKFNKEEMPSKFMQVDNDGEYISSLNLSRINYATLSLAKDKKSGEMKEKIKLTGNTIKSKVLPEYIEEFIDKGLNMILHGKGQEFVNYYYDYVDDIYFKRIPLKKIATKSRVKQTLSAYKKRGKDKNGRDKGMQTHMELLIEKREQIARKLFEEHKHEFNLEKIKNIDNIDVIMKLVANYMPAEPELDSTIYHVNSGYIKSHGGSSRIIDKETGLERYASTLLDNEDLLNNPNRVGNYNVVKYLDAFNSRVSTLLVGFDKYVQDTLLVKIEKKKIKDEFGNTKVVEELKKVTYTPEELVLKNFDNDNFEESMFLEPKEVEFWNKTGYDPRLVWNGFKMHEDDKVYYEIYDSALNYLNSIMEKTGKPKIKSINEKYEKGDYILIKDGSLYHIGRFNGIFVEILKESVNVPKSEIEIELDRKREIEEEKIRNLEVVLNKETEKEKYIKSIIAKREKYFPAFLEQFNLPKDTNMDKLFAEVEGADKTFEMFIDAMESEEEDEASEYMGVDDNNSDLL